MKKLAVVALMLFFAALGCAEEDKTGIHIKGFDPEKDLISLHYDHTSDKDDGHSAAADRTILESMFGTDWIKKHVIPVSGAYGRNKKHFNPQSDSVMKAAWDSCGGWHSAHKQWQATINEVTDRWSETLKAGGEVWVKEGGQSDFSAAVVRNVRRRLPRAKIRERIHVIQHSEVNERQTTNDDLVYMKENTDYVKIRDANAYFNKRGGDDTFVQAATTHPVFGEIWRSAFAYYSPKKRLDFSDTGELLHILEIGEISIDEFRRRFLL